MPTKTIKEIVTDISGNTTIEFSDDSLQKFNVKDTATYSTDSNGNVVGLVGPDGSVVKIADTLYILPPTTLRVTAAQTVVGKSCKLTSVKCVAGTTITLTIYDNQTLAAGSVLFSQVMSADDEAVIPNGIQAINGIYCSFTGTATFNIGVHDVV